MKLFSPQSKILHWTIMLVLAVVWGSSFILMKKGLETFPADQVGALRVSITFIFLIPFALYHIKSVKKHHWKYLLVVGFIGNFFPAFLFAEAQTGIDSSTAGILNSLAPLFTLIISVLFFKSKAKWFNVLGIFIGLAGACGLLYMSGTKGFSNNFWFGSFIVLATIMYGINLNVVKKYFDDLEPIAITAFAFMLCGIPATIYLCFTDFPHIVATNDKAMFSLLCLIMLAVIGSALALIAYYYLIKFTNVLFAASVTYMVPVIAIFWGMADGENFKLIYLLWIALILIGVLLVNKKTGYDEIMH